jgi:hypothetical protein
MDIEEKTNEAITLDINASNETEKVELPSDIENPEEPKEEIAQNEDKPKEVEKPEEKEQPEVDENDPHAQYGEFADFSRELSDKGELSKESRDAIKDKYNIPEALIDDYINSAKQNAELTEADRARTSKEFVSSVYEQSGGKEGYEKITEWAQGNLSEAEITTFNDLVGGQHAGAKLAIEGLRAKYEKAQGSLPNLVEGKSTASIQEGYSSKDQLVGDMADPRYARDAAFRREVNRKLNASNPNLLK